MQSAFLSKKTFTLSRKLSRVARKGFSLVEIIIALGVVSFSLVGILAMFPVALDTAADSKSETRVTLIAQSIFSDLRFSQASNVAIVVKTPVDASSYADANYVVHAPLTNFTSRYVAYDREGRPLRAIGKTDFEGRLTNSDAGFMASISTNASPQPGLARVDVTIVSPPQAGSASTSRKSYLFTTYLPSQ